MRNKIPIAFFLMLFIAGCSDKTEFGLLSHSSSFDYESWGLPEADMYNKGKWEMRRHNHVLSLILYFPIKQNQWFELKEKYYITEKPADASLLLDVRNAAFFAEKHLSDELNEFIPSEYISPLVHGYRNFIIYDKTNEKCLVYFRK